MSCKELAEAPAALRRIHDLLYLDMDDGRQFYNPDKEWDADTIVEIADVVADHIPRPNEGQDVNADPGATPRHPNVVIAVRGGVADLVAKPEGVWVTILDYDTDGVNPGRLSMYLEGAPCVTSQWGGSQVVGANESPPSPRKQKCPSCGHVIESSHDDLAEAGEPHGADCDRKMEMI